MNYYFLKDFFLPAYTFFLYLKMKLKQNEAEINI